MKPLHFVTFCLFLLASNSYGIDETEFQSSIKALLSKQDVNASRLKATLALEKSGDRGAVPYLISAMNDETYHHRLSAIHALGSLDGPKALDFLNSLWRELKRKNIQNLIYENQHFIKSQRAFVAAALFKLGDDQYVGYVYELIMSKGSSLPLTLIKVSG